MLRVSLRTPRAWSYLLGGLAAVLFSLLVIASPGTSLANMVATPTGPQSGTDKSDGASATATYEPGALAWHEVVTPDMKGLQSGLTDIEAVSANDIWAAGFYDGPYTATKGLLMHWDGKFWEQLPHPIAGYTLGSVSVPQPNEVWAIAALVSSPSPPYQRDYRIVRWDGRDWSMLPAPPVTGTMELAEIEAIAPDDIWVVGSKSTDEAGSDLYNLMLHWNGSAWTEYTIPGSGLRGISALASDDIWAVGHAFIHWDGSSWTVVQEYTNDLHTAFNSVVAINENDAWAVGSIASTCGTGCNATYALTAHWDGTKWDLGPSESIYANLTKVAATGPDDVWIVGRRHFNNDIHGVHHEGSIILHWDGTQLEEMSHPIQASLSGVTAISPSIVWAVGQGGRYGGVMAVLHYGKTPAFPDVPLGSPFYPYITCLSDLGFISGFPDGTFRPNDPVTRGQLAKIVANAARLAAEVPESRQTFADVPPPPGEGSTYWLYVERLYERGVIDGYDCIPGPGSPRPCDPHNRKYYLPNSNVTRGQASKIVANTAGYDDPVDSGTQTYSDVPPAGESSTFWPYIERLTARGIMGGYPCSDRAGSTTPCDTQGRPWFKPGANVTRGQAAKIVANTFHPNCQTPAGKQGL